MAVPMAARPALLSTMILFMVGFTCCMHCQSLCADSAFNPLAIDKSEAVESKGELLKLIPNFIVSLVNLTSVKALSYINIVVVIVLLDKLSSPSIIDRLFIPLKVF